MSLNINSVTLTEGWPSGALHIGWRQLQACVPGNEGQQLALPPPPPKVEATAPKVPRRQESQQGL